MNGHDIVVIGCSAGGLQALCTLLKDLPADLPAAIFVVVHTAANNGGMLPQILTKSGHLPAAFAREGQPIRHGHIYVASPDRHMMIERGRVHVSRGPKENLFRPAVDPLFRSAAAWFGPRVIGVILSGGMDDGTEGLTLIKRRGGIAIAQDPKDALVPSMPSSAIQHVAVDHILPAIELASVLDRLSRTPPSHETHPTEPAHGGKGGNVNSKELKEKDVGLDAGVLEDYNGSPSGFTCPECGGALWERKNGDVLRFRCHVGHGFTGDSLSAEQANRLEGALWTAVRSLKERAVLQRQMANRAVAANLEEVAQVYEDQAREAEQDAVTIRQILLGEKAGAAKAPPQRLARSASKRSSKSNGPSKKMARRPDPRATRKG